MDVTAMSRRGSKKLARTIADPRKSSPLLTRAHQNAPAWKAKQDSGRSKYDEGGYLIDGSHQNYTFSRRPWKALGAGDIIGSRKTPGEPASGYRYWVVQQSTPHAGTLPVLTLTTNKGQGIDAFDHADPQRAFCDHLKDLGVVKMSGLTFRPLPTTLILYYHEWCLPTHEVDDSGQRVGLSFDYYGRVEDMDRFRRQRDVALDKSNVEAINAARRKRREFQVGDCVQKGLGREEPSGERMAHSYYL